MDTALVWFAFSSAVGYLAWRGDRSIWNAFLAALTLPTIGFIVFVAIVGQRELDQYGSPLVLLAGIVVTLGALVFLNRDRGTNRVDMGA